MKKEAYITAIQKINITDKFMQETTKMLQSEENLTIDNTSNRANYIRFNNKVRKRNIYKAAAIIIIILLSTSGLTVAANKLRIVDMFKGFFKEQVKQNSIDLDNSQNNQSSNLITSAPMKEDNKFIEEASAIVSSSVTANGLKLTARGVVGDRHTIYIAVDVETVDGSAFSKSQQNDVNGLSFSKVWLKTNDNVLGQFCYVTRVDDASDIGKATFVLQNSLDISPNINHISITFTNLTGTNTDSLVSIGSQKSLLDIMNEIGEASEDDFDYMGARCHSEEDWLWFRETQNKFEQDLKKDVEKYSMYDNSYWNKIRDYMEKAIVERGNITPKYFIKRTENQTTFCSKYPRLAISNIGIRYNQLCVKFELNDSINFDNFSDSSIVIVNKKNGSIIHGSVGGGHPVNGNDDSQTDIVEDDKYISCSAQFNGVSDKEVLKDYYFAFGEGGKNTLFEGEWKLDFDLAYTDTTRVYTLSENVKIEGVDRKLDKIMISPISLQLQFQTESDVESSNENDSDLFSINKVITELNKIKIIMKDNTEVILDNESSDNDTISSVLPVVIDLEQVSAIDINGTKIELAN